MPGAEPLSCPVLSGLPLNRLAELVPGPRFRAEQVFRWIAGGADSFARMANLPAALREELAAGYLLRPEVKAAEHPASDGTVKLALDLADGLAVEAVLLRDSGDDGPARHTACLSTQAGCPAGCVFCKTGSLGFARNLTSAEIVEQFLRLRELACGLGREEAVFAMGEAKPPIQSVDDRLDSGVLLHKTPRLGSRTNIQMGGQAPLVPAKLCRWQSSSSTTPRAGLRPATPRLPVSNIVVMGMGEPLLNLPELADAVSVITDPKGIGFSPRRITVSTCGIADGITALGERCPGVRLALSLTTGDEDLRRRLMPLASAHGLARVKEALLEFQARGGGRITLEAVLLGGLNTRQIDATGIADFACGLDATV
ncbi:MAG: radical SAM protein, partial [Treponema sp.]|nr:radical SAM protein [Treponema sp.]